MPSQLIYSIQYVAQLSVSSAELGVSHESLAGPCQTQHNPETTHLLTHPYVHYRKWKLYKS